MEFVRFFYQYLIVGLVMASTNLTFSIYANDTISVPSNEHISYSLDKDTTNTDLTNYITDENEDFIVQTGNCFTSELEEVVVVGYGSIRKIDNTGSSIGLKSLDNFRSEAGDIVSSFSGRMSGVNVRNNEGGPDGNSEITIRGGTSITGDNSPLFVVDGFPVSSISDIPVSDIESVDVLKDASSTAIYGARAANGVVSITTKKVKNDGIRAEYNSEYGTRWFNNKIETLDPYDYSLLCYEWAASKGSDAFASFTDKFGTWNELSKYKNTKATDWISEIFGRKAFFMTQSGLLTYKNNNTRAKLNYEYSVDNGIMLGTNTKKHNIGSYFSHSFSTIADLDIRFSYTTKERSGAGTSTDESNTNARLKHALLYSPIPLSATDEEDFENTSSLANPVNVTNDDYRHSVSNNIRTDASLTFHILKFADIQSSVGISKNGQENQRGFGPSTSQSRTYGGLPLAKITNSNESIIRNNNTITFYPLAEKLKNEHNPLVLLLGEEYIRQTEDYTIMESRYFPSYITPQGALSNMSLGKSEPNVSYEAPKDALLSYFFRGSYKYKEKYLLTTNVRADRSSKFAKGHQWGWFPSVSIGWKISEEKFMKSAYKIDVLKLRAGIGMSGNNRISSGLHSTVYTSMGDNNKTLEIDNETRPYITIGDYKPNPDLTWETTITKNIGLDLRMLGGRIDMSVEVYSNKTTDMLLETELRMSEGYKYQMRNTGSVSNKGAEIQLMTRIVDRPLFKFNISANASYNKNRVENLGDKDEITLSSGWCGSEIGDDYILKVGEKLGSMYGFEYDGWYTVDDFDYSEGVYTLRNDVANDAALLGISTVKPGTLKLKDKNGDGIIDNADKVIIGCGLPTVYGGFSFNFNIWRFDLSADFEWRTGCDVYNANKIESTATGKYSYRNMTSDVSLGKRWSALSENGSIVLDPEELSSLNRNATAPSPIQGRYIFHSGMIEDGSYLRFQRLSFGYEFPQNQLKKLHLSKLKLYVSAYNLALLTKYSGFDPEVNVRRSTSATPSVDYSAYPKSVSVSGGIKVSF